MSEGTLQYTQQTVAFPDPKVWPLRDHCFEEFSVSFEADGGGVYGEFQLRLYEFTMTPRKSTALRAEVFMDGLEQFRDERVQEAMTKLAEIKNPVAEDVVRELEAVGAVPSAYQERGLDALKLTAERPVTLDVLHRVSLKERV